MTNHRRVKAVEKPGKSALGNRSAIPTFPQLRRRPHLSLDDRDHFLQNPPASVASLRRLITSLRNADHDQPGILITFTGIPTGFEQNDKIPFGMDLRIHSCRAGLSPDAQKVCPEAA